MWDRGPDGPDAPRVGHQRHGVCAWACETGNPTTGACWRFARCAPHVLAASPPVAQVDGHAVAGAAHALARPAESTPILLGKRAKPRDSCRFWLARLGSASARLRSERTCCCPYRQPDLRSQRYYDVAGGGETPVVAYNKTSRSGSQDGILGSQAIAGSSAHNITVWCEDEQDENSSRYIKSRNRYPDFLNGKSFRG